MKISEKQLKEMVSSEIKNMISEIKYNTMYSLVNKCINEALDQDPRFNYSYIDDNPSDEELDDETIPIKRNGENSPTEYLHYNKWGDPTDNYDYNFDNDDSWEELSDIDKEKREKLGNSAEDIFNGNYETDAYGKNDYFDNSDYAFTHNYWDDDSGKDSLANIQRDKIDHAYFNTVENVVRECINNLKRNKINETIDSGVSDTHFAILKPINKIIFSWDYSGYDNAELREFKKDYFMDDIVDMGFNPKEVKILTKTACLRQGINPEDESCWDNAFEYKVESINKRNTLKESYGDPVQSDDQNYEDYQPMEAIDFYDFENICRSNGWDWHSSFNVNNGEQTGVRYVFAQGKGCSFEELVNQIKQKANDPNGIITGTATNRNAPEIKYYSIIILFV